MATEATFKAHLRKAFSEAVSTQAHFSCGLVASMMQKAGLPDQFYSAWGQQVWIEAKCNDNHWLSGAQEAVMPSMAKAGCRVLVLWTDMRLHHKDRLVSVRIMPTGKNLCTVPWEELKTESLWKRLLNAP